MMIDHVAFYVSDLDSEPDVLRAGPRAVSGTTSSYEMEGTWSGTAGRQASVRNPRRRGAE